MTEDLETQAEDALPEGAMDDDAYEAAVKAAITDAADYIDSVVAPERVLAEKYYRGELFGNEEEGRSQVVMTEVRDVVLAMMPSLLRVFVASERPVEFVPTSGAKVAMAEQATDYVNSVFMNDNPGFTILHSAFKDALKSKIGVFKWYTATTTDVAEWSMSGLSQVQINVLSQDPTLEIVSTTPNGTGEIDPATGQPAQFFDVQFRRFTDKKRQVVECVPPEEFIIARNARDLDTADYVGHRSLKTMSELVEMGYSREDIEEHGNTASSFNMNTEAQARNPALQNFLGGVDGATDPAMRRYEYVESYIRIDKDGDGVAELRRVCTIGEGCHILHDEVVEDVKFSVICPDPESHMVIGSSMADQVMDLQLIKSNVVRNTLDSLANNIHPRTVVTEGQANMDDVLNNETGAVIRVTQQDAVRELTTTFVGQQAMPVIAWLDDVRASRTGMSKASQGLDPDVLQSTTKAAVTATMSAAQERLEMVARIFAETGIKRLFKGLLKEIVQHQDQPRVIRLRNQWVEVDPRTWDVDMDMIVNVGLGNGNAQQKIQILMMVNQDQKETLQTLGMNNPLVDLKQYRDTKAKILELSGLKDTAAYYKEITPEVLQQAAQPPQQPQQPDPTQVLAQVEADKVRKDIEIAGLKANLEATTQKASDDLERDKLDVDIYFRAKEMEAKFGQPVDTAALYAMIQRNRDLATMTPQTPSPRQPGMGFQ